VTTTEAVAATRQNEALSVENDTAWTLYYTGKKRKIEQSVTAVFKHWNGWHPVDPVMADWSSLGISRGLAVTRYRQPTLTIFTTQATYGLRRQEVTALVAFTMQENNLQGDAACTWVERERKKRVHPNLLTGKWVESIVLVLGDNVDGFKTGNRWSGNKL
jgi:hypothetical protein